MCSLVRWGALSIICSLLSGCGFFPGFGILEDPLLYVLPVGTVANQVACELQEFILEQKNIPANVKKQRRWQLANEDASVKLTLTTDTSGYVNFTGINVSKLGLGAIAGLISSQSKVPSLAAKVSGKRTRTVVVSFSVSPKPLSRYLIKDPTGEEHTPNCARNKYADNPIESLYLRDWLTNYFDTINSVPADDPYAKRLTDKIAGVVRRVVSDENIPKQFKIQSVELSTQFQIAADVSAGATPNLLGNGSVFILPINGLTADFNPDYSDKIDITLNLCDTFDKSAVCNQDIAIATAYDRILDRQCQIYAWLVPLLSGVKPPRDYDGKAPPGQCQGACTCNKSGIYVAKTT